ncbi:MAG: outer membrane beta-barrel protein [Saprospiraceae bacterium]|nr:outer membrane beta-barrel protein [Saprospiraceae bacterium]
MGFEKVNFFNISIIKMIEMKNISSVFLVLAFCLSINNKNNAQYTEIGIGMGFSTYWGDLNAPSLATNLSNNSGFAVQIAARKIYKNYFGIRGSFCFGTLKGYDANSSLEWQKIRNLSFKSSITELAIMGELYVFGINTEAGSSVFLPYFTLGLAGFKFDPVTTFRGNEIRLQPLGTEGQGNSVYGSKYSLYNFSIPVGGGAKIMISESVNISAEIILRRTFTDYLDDLSGKYVNYEELKVINGTLAANLGNRMNEYFGQTEPVQLPTGTIRGGQKIKDYYIVSMISLNVMLNNGSNGFKRRGKVNCPKF